MGACMRDMDRPRTLLHDSFIMHKFRWGVCVLALLSMGLSAVAQITYSDSFNTNANYLTNGIVGTIWDGVYFGAGEFNNSGLGGGGPGATVQCDANISTRSNLTLQRRVRPGRAPMMMAFIFSKLFPAISR